jgi:hypothetical protein
MENQRPTIALVGTGNALKKRYLSTGERRYLATARQHPASATFIALERRIILL